MEATERALFESGVRHATEATDGAALDSALDDLGWRDALAVDRRTAVSVLFEAQGATTTTSAALDWLLATALGADADAAVAVAEGLDRVTAKRGRRLFEVPVGFKWFSAGLLDGSIGFCGEESAGATFARTDCQP